MRWAQVKDTSGRNAKRPIFRLGGPSEMLKGLLICGFGDRPILPDRRSG